MPIVTDFAKAAHSQASSMIGTESVTIGSTTIQCVLSEAGQGSEFGNGGFEPTASLTAVCRADALPTGTLKKVAIARGQTWRIDALSIGGTFTTITLNQIQKA
jgi:hypothetical protein